MYRFEPIGWSKAFEFSETDLFCAMEGMDEWVDKLAQGKSNIDPNEIAWDALHAMCVQFVYGGRIDNIFDISRLTSFVQGLFTPEAFNPQFALASDCIETHESTVEIGRLGYVYPIVNNEKFEREVLARVVQISGSDYKVVFNETYVVQGKTRINLNAQDNWVKQNDFRVQKFCMKPTINLPEKTKFLDLKKWAMELDEVIASNPSVIILPPRAELMILAKRAEDMCSELLTLQEVESADALDEVSRVLSSQGNEATSTTPQWMLDLCDNAQRWLEQLPQGGMASIKETQESIKNPLFRFVRRELTIGKKVLSKMIEGLKNIIAFVKGDIKATNDLRKLISELAKEQIPKAWNAYTVYPLGVSIWIVDFVKRIEQLNQLVAQDYVNSPFEHCEWLGGIFSPEGFIAATRQYVASANQWENC